MNRGIIGTIAAIIVIVIIAAGSWYTVDQTERGVRLRYGAVVGTLSYARRRPIVSQAVV